MKRLLAFLVGIAAGIGLAMLIGWVLFPLDRQEITPASMRADYQAEYLRLVAAAYQAEGDIAVADLRLRALGASPYTAPLVVLTERWIQEGRSTDLVTPLALLALALEVDSPAMAPYLARSRE
ncbi:MAG: hypothetical protein MUF84_00830 [Anaerolineae bacterium]|jgi:hypothetical protein|nr:hypothetical protein [Anaerolineae bacterium]